MDVVRQPRTLRLPKTLHIGIALVVSVVVILFVTRLRSSPAAASGAPSVPRNTVWTDKVRRGDLLREVPAQGTLIPEHVEWLSATSAGTVSQIMLRAGAEVEPGTVVLTIINPDLELAALDAERAATSAEAALITLDVKTDLDAKNAAAALVTLKSDLGDAKRHAIAAEKMGTEGLIGDIDRADALSKARALELRVAADGESLRVMDSGRGRQLNAQRAELERLKDIAAFSRKRLATLEIRAGIKGVIQDVPLEVGQYVAMGTLLAKVAEPGRLKAEVRVAEAEAKDIHRGLPVHFDGGMIGKVSRIDPNVQRGSVRLEVLLEGALPPGARTDQAVVGHVEIERLKDVLLVTRPASASDNSALSVFKLEGEGATRTTARFGRGATREVEVTGGLALNDEIIVSDVPAGADVTAIRFK
jgi:multidrug efflux pump subunit AcrA (membrane-fusion protein)